MRGYSGTTLGVLCILSFFAGSFLRGLAPAQLPEADRGLTVHRGKGLLETAAAGGEGDAWLAAGAAGGALGALRSFEDAVDASGLLRDAPPGETGESGHSFYTVQPFQLLSWYPRAYLLPRFIDAQRAQHIVALAERRLRPSGLALKRGETAESTKNIRTSDGTFLARPEDPDGVLAWLEDKIAAVVGIPVGHGEAFNILRYQLGQHYDSHSDAFEQEQYKGTAHFSERSQRIATVLVYLSEVEEGGETVFLLEGREGLQRLRSIDYKACNTGIKVKPRMGDALLFWSVHPNGTIDKHALHGACPVVRGTKWVATKWLRNNCMRQDFC